jgi:hypothetical protein
MKDWLSDAQKDLDNMRLRNQITSSMASTSDLNDLKYQVNKLQTKVDNLISMNQKLFDIIKNPDWEKVKNNIESERDEE